ncbi:endoplasmic reticulum junction formation protein lunapark-B isoform X2 [Chrysoperla carnea]|uniref:endoplasmic reticulum junction formation protein lunapark-B isoform X2 n=1 Tax=Chrysoperla carnea TaxID=189513 RepID=UPI001D08ECDF|nr:endoplasmic reticulum junction formation protein lunapark-B isoform X2 [Chrysoperla carnea]
MGAIISKFRKKRTTYEVLENLEERIKEIEEYKSNTELQRKKLVGHFILFSVGIYVIAAVLFYFFFFPATLYDQIFYITPLLIFPIIIVLVKRLLTWYFNRKIRRNQTKLVDMKSEKRKLLDKVMETETYKKAKEILEKFDPQQLRKSPNTSSMEISPITPLKSTSLSLNTSRSLPISQGASKINPSSATQQMRPGGAPPNLPMPRTIIARERSVLDKMVEYLIGDGPNNRFALICKNCQSHNGMALREEFEYISFRCCYCYTYNPARKLRAVAPKLEQNPHQNFKQLSSDSTSESERNSPSDSDSDDGAGDIKPLPDSPSKKSVESMSVDEDDKISDAPDNKSSDDDPIKPLDTKKNE